ncbi:hypothetical protein F2P81_014465 [Scophthalmus maximus]|uniref:Protein phosphatase 1 regulatory subunit 35 C-terminal domain-containing protein n=1 Tax=Scophthalmus maximus TaxID=52904 RepID=A0A6A4SHU7_SCOMX|nr:hypothetical protein F2P81_014465 [Scophthalmus maximus]
MKPGQGQTRNTRDRQVYFEEPVVVTVAPEPHVTLSRDKSHQQPCRVVNVSRSRLLFTSLVSVNVQKDQLINQVLQDRLATCPLGHDNKASDGPSLLLFMSSDLLRQKPLPPAGEPVNYKPHPSSRPAHSTFDLCRRRRQWEALL